MFVRIRRTPVNLFHRGFLHRKSFVKGYSQETIKLLIKKIFAFRLCIQNIITMLQKDTIHAQVSEESFELELIILQTRKNGLYLEQLYFR